MIAMITAKNCEDAALWDEVVMDMDGHPLQLWGWGEVKATHGWRAHRVLCIDDDDVVVGGAQILARTLPKPFRRLCYIPRGPIWHDGSEVEVLEALVRYVEQHLPGVVLTIEPDDEELPEIKGWKSSKNTILIPNTLILDLNKGEPELLEDMSKKTRQYIRKSEREALSIRRVRSREDLSGCLELYHETAKRAGFALHNDDYYYDISEQMGESSVVYAAYEDNKPVAFLWLAVSAKTAFELYGGMNERGQALRANYMLKWHAICKCKEWGIDRYDFNGLLNDGVSTFKRGFASFETTLAGTHDYPLSRWHKAWAKGMPTARKVVQAAKKLARR